MAEQLTKVIHESKLTDMGYADLIRYTDEVNRALRRKVYAEAYEQGRIDGRLDALQDKPSPTDSIVEAYNEVYGEGFDAESFGKAQEKMREKLTEISQIPSTVGDVRSLQEIRDEIVEKAKQFVKETTERTSFTTYEFIVNKPKRTVVVLRRDIHGKVLVRGKATAHADDCFNVHIGKAIALRRAMFMDVPDEYSNVPQPTEIRVGDVVRGNGVTVYYSENKSFTLTGVVEENTYENVTEYTYENGDVDWIK